MYYLNSFLPAAPAERLRRLPLTRDQFMLLLAAVNLFFLGLDTYLAHVLNGTIRLREWIPILFGPTAGVLLLVAGLIALRRRNLATVLATVVLLASVVVGLLGAYFHVIRGLMPTAPAGQRFSLSLLVWAPPILAPMAFVLVGILGISAAWIEDPPDSGTLKLLGDRRLHLPYSKTRAYFFMTSMGVLVALLSSVMDHARTGFHNPWLWLPTVVGAFAMVAAALMGALDEPSPSDAAIYAGSMALLILVGVIGAILHVQANLTAQSIFVPERFIRGAPIMGPLLFCNMGLMGLLALLHPEEAYASTMRMGD